MPSTYTPLLRLVKQATGEATNVWGVILNNGAFELIDFSVGGVTTISAAGATTLTTANGATDQARAATLKITATTTATVTIPSVSKVYQVINPTSVDHVITNGSSSVTVYAGERVSVITDGTTVYRTLMLNMGGQRLQNLGTPQSDTDAATRKFVTDTAFASSTSFPGMTGRRTRNLRVNPAETNAEWEPDEINVSSNYAASVGDALVANTTGGSFTVTLPSTPAEGDRIYIRDGGNTTASAGWLGNPLIINPNGSTIRGDGDATTSLNIKGAKVTLRYHTTSWSIYLG